jgi:hypothetical protein
MSTTHWLGLVIMGVALTVAGCSGASDKHGSTADKGTGSPGKDTAAEAEIKANLAKLDPADRKLAEAQKTCPISGDPLGDSSMGVPVKIMLENEPVFLCCAGCEKKARAKVGETLAKVKELRAKAASQ